MKLEEFTPGMCVRYIPLHAHQDRLHNDCQNGVVSSTNSKFVFVRYIKNNVQQQTAQATDPMDLILWN